MAENIPSWLDKTFLAKALQGGDDVKPKVTVISFSAKPAIAAGDNFSSYLFRVQVQYKVGGSPEEQAKSLIVKLPVKEGLIYEIAKTTQFYDKETIFYGELLQTMSDKMQCQFAPKSFYSPIEGVIVLEDLKPDYFVADKYKQLDFTHSKLVFTTLAQFHASALAVYHENPKLIESVSGESLYPKDGPIKGWIEFATKTVGEILHGMEGCQEYADIFLSRADNIWELAVEGVKAKPGRLNVLLHGDVWVNNMMFKYNKNKEPVDVKLLDFQIARYSTPILDLLYFILTSANEDVREHKLHELFDLYLKTLNASLEKLGCRERMTAEELRKEIKSSQPWFITTVVFGLTPIMVHGTEDGQDYEGVTREDIESGKMNPKFEKMYNAKRLKTLLPTVTRQYLALLAS